MVPWFNVFSGIVVYKVKPDGVSDNDMWININEYVKIFERDNLRLNGIPYEKETGREEEVINAIIANAGILCDLGLLERNRGISPPRLDYRVTKKGRNFDQLRGKRFGEFRRKFFFFRHVVFQRLKKYKRVITVAAFLMAALNAVKFYSLALTWISDGWVLITSVVIFVGAITYAFIAGN